MNKPLIVFAGNITALNQLDPRDTLLRCKYALRKWKTGKYTHLVLLGGIFNEPSIQTIAAAYLMRDWFISNGVKESAILVENKSLDTFENVHKCMTLLRDENIYHPGAPSQQSDLEITVVSELMHTLRIWLTFFFVYNVRVVRKTCYYPVTLFTFLSEPILLLLHLLDPKGKSWLPRLNRQNRAKKAALGHFRTHHSNGGFTIIEGMIVVVIIGILASVAIPQYLKYRMEKDPEFKYRMERAGEVEAEQRTLEKQNAVKLENQEVAEQIRYFIDQRTHVCFARIFSPTSNRYKVQSITTVDCEKVKQFLEGGAN